MPCISDERRQDNIFFGVLHHLVHRLFSKWFKMTIFCDIICKTHWITQVSRYTRISEQPISAAVFTWPLSCHGVLTKLFNNWEDHTGQTRQGTCTAQTQIFLSLWYKLLPGAEARVARGLHFFRAWKPPACIHNSVVARCTFTIF